MPTCNFEHSEAVRRYYAAFPALKKGEEPLQYYLPPPAWCRKPAQDPNVKMQSEPLIKDWNTKNKKFSSGKERRNSYHGQKKNKKRCNSYSRSFDSKESLPEWVTHEGVWDMETQDPVKEFIRAIALDEGYGTCENTVTDEIKEITQVKIRMSENTVPDWDDSLDLDTEWVINEDLKPRVLTPMEEELYAKFEAKFDRSIEALWSKDQNTPDDEYQDLPIDFQDLLSSPSDHLFADPSAEKCSLISLTESIWSNDGFPTVDRTESPSRIVEVLHDRFKPLNLADAPPPPPAPREIESFSLYEGEEIYDALSTVAKTMRSFTAINHSRDRSGFAEVPPRRQKERPALAGAADQKRAEEPRRTPSREREDLLTSARTHFRPIRRESESETAARYVDGDTFDIRGDLDPVEFRRSESGGLYLETSLERYCEYRAGGDAVVATRRRGEARGLRLRFPLRQMDAAAQTEGPAGVARGAWGACDECGGTAKKPRGDGGGIGGIWSSGGCGSCRAEPAAAPVAAAPPPDELSREWEELLGDISAAHAEYARAAVEDALVSAERKRRHSAALRGAPAWPAAGPRPPGCSHPHARFLHCCAGAGDRPLTR
ncbi:uncharacterized protein LOC126371465 isoform X2 [Pectinophora gossypiella]|nr:uncharacterized protein LOC126371465 isoform X2 [Pectinophora gossypiella]